MGKIQKRIEQDEQENNYEPITKEHIQKFRDAYKRYKGEMGLMVAMGAIRYVKNGSGKVPVVMMYYNSHDRRDPITGLMFNTGCIWEFYKKLIKMMNDEDMRNEYIEQARLSSYDDMFINNPPVVHYQDTEYETGTNET